MLLKLLAKKEAWITEQDGATAIEYGLIAAGIAVAISAVVFTFGEELAGMFSDMATEVGEAAAVEWCKTNLRLNVLNFQYHHTEFIFLSPTGERKMLRRREAKTSNKKRLEFILAFFYCKMNVTIP